MTYDSYLLGLHPQFFIPTKLLIRDLHSSIRFMPVRMQGDQENETDMAFLCFDSDDHSKTGSLMRVVEVMGTVIEVKSRAEHLKFHLDDGTGVLECFFWLNVQSINTDQKERYAQQEKYKRLIQIGSTLLLRGKVSEYEGVKQLSVNHIYDCSNDSKRLITHWYSCVKLKKEVYSKEFQLPAGFEEFVNGNKHALNKHFYGNADSEEESDHKNAIVPECEIIQQLKLIAAGRLSIDLSELITNEQFMEYAEKELAHISGQKLSSSKIMKAHQLSSVVSKELERLCKAGQLICSDSEYAFVTFETVKDDLKELIEEFFERRNNNDTQNNVLTKYHEKLLGQLPPVMNQFDTGTNALDQDEINEVYILNKFIRFKNGKYRNIDKSIISEFLNKLVIEGGFIYESGYKTYRML
ncbi:hypothetical protein MP638_000681 [Amoeboaphelidium occidentale]|nr:hypothetical protein MP638_000681 [Amoeboaphelidium occidentale]